MADSPLACSVRNCGLPLARHDRLFLCPAGHAFDLARSGYINLLQPQDRRSTTAGDSKAAVEARAALDQSGVGRAVVNAIVEQARGLGIGQNSVVVDLGSGSGEMLGRMSTRLSVNAIGIDLSVAAADFAARRFPSSTWVVANADRRLPLLERSVDLVLSVYGRRHPSECARVLKPGGILIVALPGHDDLLELRALVQGKGISRHRSDAMIAEHRAEFSVANRATIRDTIDLDRDALLLLLRGTYRGARFAQAPQVDSITGTSVTLSTDVVTLQRLN